MAEPPSQGRLAEPPPPTLPGMSRVGNRGNPGGRGGAGLEFALGTAAPRLKLVAMRPLEPPDLHHARAVHGWLDLDNPREATLELARVSEPARSHPEVLEARWRLCAVERRWEDALVVADALVAAEPDAAVGYVDRAYALHELRRTAEARDLLLPLARRFPQASVIPYNLACYACQLGDLPEARRWLKRALKLREREELRRRALEDPDLAALWTEIRTW